ncbi:MAG: AraC family transcriptional regulator [Opitutaceae bacterium]|jgi:AraC-like DNA-binding protein|nr:AraC family transcriptional regulator [Opitutaceae bacterium]
MTTMPLIFDHDDGDASDEKTEALRRHLDELPLDTRFRQKELADTRASGAGSFAAFFRKLTGLTPKRYFDRRRMAFCRRQLADPLMPVKVIAIDLGFQRLSDFSEWVTLRFGASPRQCRELLLAKKPLPKYPL